ncbi:MULTISPECIES: hypothetical protein [Niastella]|uniref:Uncharacterized protein n=1 Tax=Niastella soli TaxID=2821487 RepID=A0ABS3Z5B1_9BACT|nr:hypothetical protein [Niastella soli]MBO9205228.1 hypothetical protein [Niastella soli]
MRITLLVMLLIISSRIFAQDTARANWNQQVKVALNMKEKQYARYIAANETYDRQVSKIMNDTSLDRRTQIAEISKALTEKRTVIKQVLTEDQLKKLAEPGMQRPIVKGPNYYKHQQEREAYMKKKIQDRARADSARLKPPCQIAQSY